MGFKAVVVSLPYRSDDAIRLNPDLTGRILVIEIEPWKTEELEEDCKKRIWKASDSGGAVFNS
ncbi:MAG: hypothetical protein ACLR1V_05930 [Coprococcus sp.]